LNWKKINQKIKINMIKSDFKKVNKFLKQLNSTEYLYLKHTMDVVDMINILIKNINILKNYF